MINFEEKPQSCDRCLRKQETLLSRVNDFENKFKEDVPRPEHWGGFALNPIEFEFWQDGEFRLHDRFILKKLKGSYLWKAVRYYP